MCKDQCYPSKETHLLFGVPQGFILEPILFTHYTSSMTDIAKLKKIDHHYYVEDTQLFVDLEKPNQHFMFASRIYAIGWCKTNLELTKVRRNFY